MKRKFGEVDYYLTQLLYGHGYFCKYMYKMGKKTWPKCIYDDAWIDDTEYTFFHCEKWVVENRNLETKFGVVTIENFCECDPQHRGKLKQQGQLR